VSTTSRRSYSGSSWPVRVTAEDELVAPMFVTRTGHELPEYDLRDVVDTLRVRVTKSEYGAVP